MFKHYFERIEGIEFYAIFSLLLFFSFFILCIVWIIKLDKKYIKKMENLPLESNESEGSK
jgi:cbb3-type cytochrome oxidase subunit 3